MAACSILLVGTIAYFIGERTIERQAQARLADVAESRAMAIETWFDSQASDLATLASNPATAAALTNFEIAWNELPGATDAERRAYLHKQYVDGSPFPAGDRNKLEAAPDGSPYSRLHGTVHAGFDHFREAKGLYDIFLVDTDGRVVYTVYKEDDFGDNVLSGRLADSGLGLAVQKALQDTPAGSVSFADFMPYAPSYGAPASFIATPLHSRSGTLIGVLAFQLPIDRLNAVMRDPTGLGDTGQAYLVGADGKMHSAARFTTDDTILMREVAFADLDGVIAGTTLIAEATGLGGDAVLMDAIPVDLLGSRAALIVEQSLSEVRAPIAELTRQMILGAIVALALVSLFCILFARSLARPLGSFAAGIVKLGNLDWSAQFDGIKRSDEIGTIARGLKKLRYDLEEFDTAAQAALFKSSAIDRASVGVMTANRDFTITYVNQALIRMVETNIDAFREVAPALSANGLIGMNMDFFHGNPQRIRAALSDMSRLPMQTDIPVGNLTFALDISNVLDAAGQTVGYVVEWVDATADRRNTEVVNKLRAALERLSGGDLTIALDDGFEGDYAQLREDFNAAIEKLGDAIATVVDTSVLIKGEAQEISGAADDLARRTEQQAATLEQTAAALDQLTSSVSSAAASAKEANVIVSAARSEAEESGVVVREAVSAMHQIDASSTQIGKIISVIEEIAFQTNLLALNAGVEAARAGDAGRGFAVVASEVRALARRASDAAKEIGGLIQGSTDQVKRGVTLVEKAGTALERIVGSVKDIDGRVSDIAVSAQEQASGLAEINISVNQLDQVTQQNAAMFEQMSAASQSLNTESQVLLGRTQSFSVANKATAPATEAKNTFTTVRNTAEARPAKKAVAAAPMATKKVVNGDDWDEF